MTTEPKADGGGAQWYLSLRDHFAGLAMQGLLTSGVDNVADRALYEADALIAALKEKKA